MEQGLENNLSGIRGFNASASLKHVAGQGLEPGVVEGYPRL